MQWQTSLIVALLIHHDCWLFGRFHNGSCALHMHNIVYICEHTCIYELLNYEAYKRRQMSFLWCTSQNMTVSHNLRNELCFIAICTVTDNSPVSDYNIYDELLIIHIYQSSSIHVRQNRSIHVRQNRVCMFFRKNKIRVWYSYYIFEDLYPAALNYCVIKLWWLAICLATVSKLCHCCYEFALSVSFLLWCTVSMSTVYAMDTKKEHVLQKIESVRYVCSSFAIRKHEELITVQNYTVYTHSFI